MPIDGTNGNDTIEGTALADIIRGLGGDDDLSGLGGADRLAGGSGDDVLDGGAGADTLNGGAGLDYAYYGLSNVGVMVNLSAGTGSGGHAQGDTLIGIENVVGTNFNDVITGSSADNILLGWDGRDRLSGGSGDDELAGGRGADTLNGGTGLDMADYWYIDSNGGVTINLANGTASGGHAQGDVLINIENVRGSKLDDTIAGSAGDNILIGSEGRDRLSGWGGDDELAGWTGADTINGGTGTDEADYARSNAAVRVSLTTGTGAGGHAQGDRLTNIENVQGSRFNDTITGDGAGNLLLGGAGNDTIKGGSGLDGLHGGAGRDRLTGGSDTDWFNYVEFSFGKDVITDYDDSEDAFYVGDSGLDYDSFTVTQDGADTLLTLISDPSNTIRLKNVSAADIGSEDFIT